MSDMRRTITLVLAVSLLSLGGAASAQTPPAEFSDVPADHARKADIEYAVARGWLTGFDDGTFQPERVLTLAEIVDLVNRIFDDVSAASEEGVSRLDMALFLQHGNQALTDPAAPSATAPEFSDWPPAAHEGHEDADASVAYVAARGWFRGYPDGTFRAERAITDRQTAAVLERAFPQGLSRAEMAAYVLHGNRAVIAHEASRAWDLVSEAGTIAQDAWAAVCDDLSGPNPMFNFPHIIAGYTLEAAAEDALADAWRADVDFWETAADPTPEEEEALLTAQAAAVAWDASADAERGLAASVVEDLTTEEGRQAATEAAWAARAAEKTAWDAARDATAAGAAAEARAEPSVREAWETAAEKAEEAVAAWDEFTILNLAAACQNWVDAWTIWKDWAAAMSIANDALAAVA